MADTPTPTQVSDILAKRQLTAFNAAIAALNRAELECEIAKPFLGDCTDKELRLHEARDLIYGMKSTYFPSAK